LGYFAFVLAFVLAFVWLSLLLYSRLLFAFRVRYFHQLVQECKCVILTGVFSSFPSPPNNNPAETRMHFLSPPMTVSQV
jgi:hypothetical protein